MGTNAGGDSDNDGAGLAVDIGATHTNGDTLIDIDGEGADLTLSDGGNNLGSAFDAQGLLDVNAGPDNGGGDALVNVKTDGSNGVVDAHLGLDDTGGDPAPLDVQGLLDANLEAGSGDENALVIANLDSGALEDTADLGLVGADTLGSPSADGSSDISVNGIRVVNSDLMLDSA